MRCLPGEGALGVELLLLLFSLQVREGELLGLLEQGCTGGCAGLLIALLPQPPQQLSVAFHTQLWQ